MNPSAATGDPERAVLAQAENLALFLTGLPDDVVSAKLLDTMERMVARLTPMQGGEMAEELTKRFVAYVVARKALIEGVGGYTATPQ